MDLNDVYGCTKKRNSRAELYADLMKTFSDRIWWRQIVLRGISQLTVVTKTVWLNVKNFNVKITAYVKIKKKKN